MGLQLLVKIFSLKQFKFYLALSKISKNSEEFIFRSLSRDKKFSQCTRNKPISYSRIREVLLKFQPQRILIGKTSGYTAFDQVGSHLSHTIMCQIYFFKPHARWKSHRVNYRYTEDNLESPLSVSKNLETYFLQKLLLLLRTRQHGSTSRKLSFSFTHSVVEENK